MNAYNIPYGSMLLNTKILWSGEGRSGHRIAEQFALEGDLKDYLVSVP